MLAKEIRSKKTLTNAKFMKRTRDSESNTRIQFSEASPSSITFYNRNFRSVVIPREPGVTGERACVSLSFMDFDLQKRRLPREIPQPGFLSRHRFSEAHASCELNKTNIVDSNDFNDSNRHYRFRTLLK